MSDVPSAPLSGRKAQALRNHGRILDAAREVFLADPEAPVASVAARAGVGISALYRRYPSKEHLLRALAEDGLRRYSADLEVALADDGDVWDAFATCLERVLDGQSQALAQRLAGTFTPTPELSALARQTGELAAALFQRVRAARLLRDDVTEGDVTLLLEAISLVKLAGPDADAALRRRYLAVVLQGLRAPAESALPGSPPSNAALGKRWRTRR